MKRLSNTTLELFKDFSHEFQSRLRRSIFGSAKAVSLLDRISAAREPMAIVHLTPFLFQPDRRLALDIARTIETLVRALKPEELVALDSTIRRYCGSVLPWNMEVSEVQNFEDLQEFAWIPLAVATMYKNGFVRERATTLLLEYSNSAVLPFLILRTNDWVDNVRVKAISHIRSILKPDYAEILIENAYLLFRLESSRGFDRDEIAREAFRVLQLPESRSKVLEGLNANSQSIQRMCYRIALDSAGMDKLELLEKGLRSPDVIIRFDCISRIEASEPNKDSKRLALLALADPHMRIRQRGLSLLSCSPFNEVRETVYAALSDRSLAIRQTARAIILRSEHVNNREYFAEYYRSQLSTAVSHRFISIILGIGETGMASDAETVFPYLSHPRASVRKAAIQAFAKLRGDESVAALFDRLVLDSQLVSRAAARAICSFRSTLAPDFLHTHFTQSTKSYVKLHLLLLIMRLPKWNALHLLLLAFSDEDPEVKAKALLFMKHWLRHFNQGDTRLSAGTRDAVRAALEHLQEQLEPSLARQLEFYSRG